MISVKKFIFNPFQVNAYVLYDETGECTFIDPAVSDEKEFNTLTGFVKENNLIPKMIVNTHAHIDHIIGNYDVASRYKIKLATHPDAEGFLTNALKTAEAFGLPMSHVKEIDIYIDGNTKVKFGDSCIKALHTPGHADGSICLYSEKDSFVVTGDVLFYESIGRTDLQTGNYDLLQKSIWEELFTLPDDTKVYPGHGPDTTIGHEKTHNPFVAIGME